MFADGINIYKSYIFYIPLFSNSSQNLLLMKKYKAICINVDTFITYVV